MMQQARRSSWGPARSGMLFWAAFAFIYVCSTLYYCSLPPTPDQSLFDYIAYLSTRGAPYYSGAFEMTWPGPLVYHELGVRLFGVQPWTARLTDMLLLPFGLAGLWLIAREAGYRWAATGAVLAYPIIYVTSGEWMGGHRDIVGMHLLLCAAGLLLSPKRPPWLLPLAGALIGYAVMIRPTYLLFAVPAWAMEMHRAGTWRERIGSTLQLAAGGIAVLLAFLIAAIGGGWLDDWYEQAVLFPLSEYQKGAGGRAALIGQIPGLIRAYWAWLAATAAVGGVLLLIRSWRSRLVFCLGALVVTVLVSFTVQNKGFGYHLGGLTPIFVIVIALGIEAGVRLGRDATERGRLAFFGAAGLAALAASVGVAARVGNFVPMAEAAVHGRLGGYLHYRTGTAAERRQVADVIRRESAPGDLVLQWGWAYEAAFLSERRSATRFVNTVMMGNPFQSPRFDPWLDELRAELVPERVRFILLDEQVVDPAACGRPPAGAPSGRQILLGLCGQGYSVRFKTPTLTLLERVG